MNAKKLISLVLALVMMLALATSAMAAVESDGKITITNAEAGTEYSLYRVFDVDKNGDAVVYTINSNWTGFFAAEAAGASYIVDTATEGTALPPIVVNGAAKYINITDSNVAAFAAAAISYAKTNSVAAVSDPTAATTTNLEFTDLEYGYYLIDSTLGTVCSLTSASPTAEITEKNEKPSNEKEVEEDSTDKYGETNDADIGQVVNFQTTITVQKGAVNYVLHDEMSDGLTYKQIDSIKIGETTVEASNYTLTITGLTDDCDFEIAFKDDYIKTLTAGTKIVVSYSAVLNENAKIGIEGNPNKTKLSYGEKATPDSTPEDTTITYTWDLDVMKYTSAGTEKIPLAGAKFILSKSANLLSETDKELSEEDKATAIKFHKAEDSETYKVCVDTTCTETHVTEIETTLDNNANGTFSIDGLDADTYYLYETVAPANYNKLTAPIKVVITGATKDTDSEELEYTTIKKEVENNSGTQLPSTGGMGTTVLYIAGGLLIVAAVIMMAAKRRENAAE